MLRGKQASEVISERQQHVNSLKRYVSEKKKQLEKILNQLQLTKESLTKVEPKQICPFDQNHSVPERNFKKHVEQCRLLKAGYQRDELPSQLQNLDICYKGTDIVKVNVDENLLNKIIWDECAESGLAYTGRRTMPVSHIDEVVNLTQSDRLAVYKYVSKLPNKAGKVIQVDHTDQLLTTDWGQLVKKGMLNEQSNQQYSSKLEQLAALRDMKRRRQSYRAKNVHVTKKSYTEIIREVIVNQMEIVTQEKEIQQDDVPDEVDEVKSSSRDRKRRRRDSDDKRTKDSYGVKRRRSRERYLDGKYDQKEKQHGEQSDYEKVSKISCHADSPHNSDSSDFSVEKLDKKEKQSDHSSHQRRNSESSWSSNNEDDYRKQRSKHKRTKHKKKHRKKHKRKDRTDEV